LKDYLQLHFIVLLFGFTAILGKIISIDATNLVAYRMLLAAFGLGIYAHFSGKFKVIPIKTLAAIIGVGAIVALHWITFFGAVKVSNVSVTLGSLASGTLFTSILEPLLERRRISALEVIIGIVIIIGLYIITTFAFDYYLGIILALISAFLASVFGVLNRQLTQKYDAILISFYEMLAGFVLIALYFSCTGGLSLPNTLSHIDIISLLVLAWLCTSYAFAGTVHLLKRLSAFTVSLAINMEPIYGILLAYFIFGESEKMNVGFYIGAGIILLSIFLHPILKKRYNQ